MLNSLARIKWDMIEEQAHQLLNEKEQGTLRYYLNEYQKGFIRVDGLVMALFELLNTHAKVFALSFCKRKFTRNGQNFNNAIFSFLCLFKGNITIYTWYGR